MTRYLLASASSGLLWTALVGIIFGAIPSSGAYLGALAFAPVIGALVGLAYLPAYRFGAGVRFGAALVCLYLGAGLYGAAAGLTEAAFVHPHPNVSVVAVALQTALGAWWGLTYSGYLLLFLPLAFANHALLGHLLRQDTTGPLPRVASPAHT